MDIQSKLFETALGIEEPLYIKDITFDEEIGELHIFVDFRRGSKFICPVCNQEHCSVHDTTEKVWRHLNFFQYKCYIHFRNPKIKCDTLIPDLLLICPKEQIVAFRRLSADQKAFVISITLSQ